MRDDRFAKGIRAAPTDALLADLSPTGQQGAVYGLYHAASTMGSMAGGLLACLIMHFTGNNFKAVFSFSVLPAVLAVTCPVRNNPRSWSRTRSRRARARTSST